MSHPATLNDGISFIVGTWRLQDTCRGYYCMACSTACNAGKLSRPATGVLVLRPAIACCGGYSVAHAARLQWPVQQSYPTSPTPWPPPPCCNNHPACAGAGSQCGACRLCWLHRRDCGPGQHTLCLPSHPHRHPGTTQGDALTRRCLHFAARKSMHGQLRSQQLLVRQHGAQFASAA